MLLHLHIKWGVELYLRNISRYLCLLCTLYSANWMTCNYFQVVYVCGEGVDMMYWRFSFLLSLAGQLFSLVLSSDWLVSTQSLLYSDTISPTVPTSREVWTISAGQAKLSITAMDCSGTMAASWMASTTATGSTTARMGSSTMVSSIGEHLGRQHSISYMNSFSLFKL